MPTPLSLNKRRGFDGVSLTMTYFHARECTIIGAVSFHGPVRDGKGWFQDAMDTRLKGEGSRGQRRGGPGDPLEEVKGWVVMRKVDAAGA